MAYINVQKRVFTRFISSFLKVIGITERPKMIVRLGKPNEGNKRPVKLIMN